MAKVKITDLDLYLLLDVLQSATEQEIKKAYRKKALKFHPDKNPDPKAAELFHQLSEALLILTDAKAREAYDRTLKSKELAKQRTRQLDSKRRKFKEDLEKKEREAKESGNQKKAPSFSSASDDEKLQREIDRLKKEGSKILAEEQAMFRQLFKGLTPSNPITLSNASSISSTNASNSASMSSFEEFEARILQKMATAAKTQKRKQEES